MHDREKVSVFINKLILNIKKKHFFALLLIISIIANLLYIKFSNVQQDNILSLYNVINYISIVFIIFIMYVGIHIIFLANSIKEHTIKKKVKKVGLYVILLPLLIFIWGAFDLFIF